MQNTHNGDTMAKTLTMKRCEGESGSFQFCSELQLLMDCLPHSQWKEVLWFDVDGKKAAFFQVGRNSSHQFYAGQGLSGEKFNASLGEEFMTRAEAELKGLHWYSEIKREPGPDDIVIVHEWHVQEVMSFMDRYMGHY